MLTKRLTHPKKLRSPPSLSLSRAETTSHANATSIHNERGLIGSDLKPLLPLCSNNTDSIRVAAADLCFDIRARLRGKFVYLLATYRGIAATPFKPDTHWLRRLSLSISFSLCVCPTSRGDLIGPFHLSCKEKERTQARLGAPFSSAWAHLPVFWQGV